MKREAGFSLLEVVTTTALMALLSAIVISNIKELENPLADASFQVTHFLRLARSRAISQTLAIEVSPSGTTRIIAKSSTSCAGTMTTMPDLSLDLPDGAHLTSTSWVACFTQRGMADDYVTFDITGENGTRTVEIGLGGGVQIQ